MEMPPEEKSFEVARESFNDQQQQQGPESTPGAEPEQTSARGIGIVSLPASTSA